MADCYEPKIDVAPVTVTRKGAALPSLTARFVPHFSFSGLMHVRSRSVLSIKFEGHPGGRCQLCSRSPVVTHPRQSHNNKPNEQFHLRPVPPIRLSVNVSRGALLQPPEPAVGRANADSSRSSSQAFVSPQRQKYAEQA